jgi:hypothetical protein
MIDQCAYHEVCKHYRGDEGETCKIQSLCKFFLDCSPENEPKREKRTYKKRGRPAKADSLASLGTGDLT